MSYLQVQDNPKLARDVESLAIINTSKSDYDAYMRKRESYTKERQELLKQAEDIESLKNDFAEIKSLLLNLLNNNKQS